MFTLPVRVYWEDTDAGGIVFYANYLKFMERARTEWLRSCGVSQHTLKELTGGMFVVTQTQLKYLQAARLDDLLQVSVQVLETGRASLSISQEIRRQSTSSLRKPLSNQESLPLVCHGTIGIAWVHAGTLKPGRIPTSVMEVLN
jgi:acyl-CoA thioester hydrolase